MSKLSPKHTARLDHRVFGPGSVLDRKLMHSGEAVLIVRFDDGVTRGELLWPELWNTPLELLHKTFLAP